MRLTAISGPASKTGIGREISQKRSVDWLNINQVSEIGQYVFEILSKPQDEHALNSPAASFALPGGGYLCKSG